MVKPIRIIHAVGARPNFMKAAPVMAAMGSFASFFEQVLVHTGQHYDVRMSERFFSELGLPAPDVHLGVGSGSHAQQTAKVLLAFEETLLSRRPDWLCVYGDVNSTLACALAAAKMGIRTAHVEAGLRSFDREMPEEWNRRLTDQISDLLFTTEESANRNLIREGFPAHKIHFVGNVMIDTLVRLLPKAEEAFPAIRRAFGLNPFEYVLVTLHRPSNVDRRERLEKIVKELQQVASRRQVVFPVHPRTSAVLGDLDLGGPNRPILLEPLGYVDFLALQSRAALVLTDSGGVQEETTFLGTPCLTLRPNTERPVTVESGTNRLASLDTPLSEQISLHLENCRQAGTRVAPKYWDGRAASRIVEAFLGLEGRFE